MKRFVGFAALLIILISLAGCDNFSVLAQFSRNAPLALKIQYNSLEQDGTSALYPSGGVPPYTFGVVAGDLFYAGTSIGSVANGVYTAGNAIGTVEIMVTDSIGESANAAETIVPPTPGGLTATASSRPPSVSLSWSYPNPSLITGFEVWRSTNGVSFTQLTSSPLPATATTYSDTSVTQKTSYWYQVYAVDGSVLSLPSPVASATP